MKDYQLPTDQYWCQLEGEELLDACHAKIDKYYSFIQTSGIHSLWKRSLIAFYGGDLNHETSIFDSAKLSKSGKVGQVSKGKINTYANLIKHSINLATANKNSLTCVASNTDYKSQAQTVLGSSLLDYYLTEQGVGQKNRRSTEYSCLTGEGWIHAPWAPSAGEIYEVVDGKPVYEGDLDISYHGPHDIIRETSLKHTDFPWLIVRSYNNKWDLIAEHEDLRDELLAESNYDYEKTDSFRLQITNNEDEQSDELPVYTLYHNKTPAMPEGRLVIFTKSIILFDGPLPYDEMPLKSIMPAVLHESCFGYSPFADLLCLQQASDNVFSTLLSNNLSFGKQFLWKQKGGGFNVSDLDGGLKLIESEVKPEALQLLRSSPESYQFLQALNSYMEELSSINSTVRGNPPANATSGAAMALLVSQAIQFGSGLEEEYDKLLSSVGTTIIDHLKTFAQTPRLAFIAGESSRPYMKQFQAEDISEIRRVTVQQTNAMSKTVAGRLEIANQVMQMPPDKARMYMSIINTGQLPDEYKLHGSIMGIQAENEAMQNGEDVMAVITEQHADHIRAHASLIESPEAKENPELVTRVLQHIQNHLDLWRKADPAMLMITGQQPPPPDNSPATILQQQQGIDMQPQQPQGPTQGPQPLPQSQVPGNMPIGDPLLIQGPEQVNQPSQPNLPQGTDPITQQAYDKIKGA